MIVAAAADEFAAADDIAAAVLVEAAVGAAGRLLELAVASRGAT